MQEKVHGLFVTEYAARALRIEGWTGLGAGPMWEFPGPEGNFAGEAAFCVAPKLG